MPAVRCDMCSHNNKQRQTNKGSKGGGGGGVKGGESGGQNRSTVDFDYTPLKHDFCSDSPRPQQRAASVTLGDGNCAAIAEQNEAVTSNDAGS